MDGPQRERRNSSDRARNRVGERPHIRQAVDFQDGLGELRSPVLADVCVAEVRLEFREQLAVAQRIVRMAFGTGLLDFARAERPVRAKLAATDVALRGGRIGRATDFRYPFAQLRRRRYFFGKLTRRHFAVGQRARYAPVDAELCVHPRLRRAFLGDVATYDVVRLQADDELDAIDFFSVAAKLRLQIERRADRRMRESARGVGLDREAVEFPIPYPARVSRAPNRKDRAHRRGSDHPHR